jgi:hypothetical protein
VTKKKFVRWEFESLGSIEPERDETGALIELFPQARYKNAATAILHTYGIGPFCRFRIGQGQNVPGLYVVTLDGTPVYAGECVDLAKRWGPNGYGGISPRNCFVGGQSTNCRLNAAILSEAKAGREIDLWFYGFDGDREDRLRSETILIQTLQPVWNLAKKS